MQPLSEFTGDIESLITEMKRRAGVLTDTELAQVIGTSQSNVSTWRKRGAVPKSALLRFDSLDLDTWRGGNYVHAARMVALRVGEFWYDEYVKNGATAGRWLPYATVAMALPAIVERVAKDIRAKVSREGMTALEHAVELIEDESYLGDLVSWLRELPAAGVAG
jgi:hypothetical protein